MRNCDFCGTLTSNKRYCSQSCAGNGAAVITQGRQMKPRHPCLECKGPTLNKFCSRSCSASYTNRLSPKRKLEGICRNCKIPCRSNYIYCSLACKEALRYQSYITRWLANEETGSQANGEICTPVRRWVRSLKGEQCWDCGWAKVNFFTGRVPVQVEHIDGHFDNNRPENLKLLCPNCHSLTSTWGNSNKGNGRKYRYAKV